jgi:hypothetical protein
MNRFPQLTIRLATARVASLLAGVGGFGLWGAVAGLTIGLGYNANQPVYAEDQQKPQGGDQQQTPPPKQQQQAPQPKAELTPQQQKDRNRATLQREFERAKEARLKYFEAGCGTNEVEKTKAKENLDEAERKLDSLIDAYNDFYPSAEYRKAIERYNSAESFLLNPRISDNPTLRADLHKTNKERLEAAQKEERDRVRKALEEGKELTLVAPTGCPSYAILAPNGEPATVTVNVNYVNLFSTTTFISPTDTLKVKNDPTQVQLNGRANYGPWFLNGQLSFGGNSSGSFTDMFPAFPAANFSGNVNSGPIYDVIADAGYNFLQGPELRVGAFGGYYSLSEYLYGTIAGGTATIPILADHWQAMRVGVSVEKAFSAASWPFLLKLDIAGLPIVNLQSGGLNAHGDGVQGDVRLIVPIPYLPLTGNIFFQDTYMTVSGTSVGVPMTVRNDNWAIGAGLSYSFGGTTHPAPAYPVKAPPK